VSFPAAIVDTNVVVAGLLTSRDEAPVARILDGMLGAAFPFVVSEALIGEYHRVLSRAELRTLHGLSNLEIDTILTTLARHAIVLTPVFAPPAPDPGDQLLWELLSARIDLILVTGDKRLIRDAGMRGRVISPQVFMEGV
jgi:uncharacterized protein